MKKLIFGLAAVILAAVFFSCTNSNDAPGTGETVPAAAPVSKTINIDVRTAGEWIDDGHANCSVNYPLAELDKHVDALRSYDKIIVVCRSGSRAEVAKEMLEQAGIKHVENKGAWQNIECK